MAATLEKIAPSTARRVEIQVADNGYVVDIFENQPDYKHAQLVFTSQASMLKAVKEATTMSTKEEEK